MKRNSSGKRYLTNVKKALAMVMCMVLMLGMVQMPAKATGETDETLTQIFITGVASYTNANTIYLNLSASTGVDTSEWRSFASDSSLETEGILYNGVKLAVNAQTTWTDNMFCIQPGKTPETGDILKIVGTFKYEDIRIQVSEYVLLYDGSSWVKFEEKVYTPISITGVDSNTSADTIYLNLSAGTGAGTWASFASDSSLETEGILYNGVKLAVNAQTTWVANMFCIQPGKTPITGDKLTIKGNFACGNILLAVEAYTLKYDGTNWIEYVEQIQLAKPVISISGNTVSWNAVENATNYEIYVDGEEKAETTATSYDLSAFGLELGSYQVTVKATGGENTIEAISDAAVYTVMPTNLGTMIITGVDETTLNFNNFYINCTGVTKENLKQDVPYNPINEESGVFLNNSKLTKAYIIQYGWIPNVFFKDDITSEDSLKRGDVLVIKGTFRNGKEQFDVKETTFLWNGSVWVMYVPLENIHKVTLTPHNVHNAANVVYISAASDPASSFEADKNFRPGSYNGTVSLNDVVLTEGTDYAFMTSYSPNALYSVQLLNGRTWNTGDKLSISGQFAYNGTTEGIEVSGFTMWFDGIAWTTTEVVLKTPGDLNNDGAWTVLDLVRFKKYLASGIAAEYKSVTELTGDGVVDHNDVQELRYIILGKHQVINGQIVTKYLSDDKINIFADGPVVQNNDALVKAYFNAGFTTLVMTEDFTGAMDADGNTGITNADGTLDDDYRNCITTALKYGDVMVRNHSNTSDYFTENLYTQLYDLGVRQFYIWDEPTPQNNGFFGIGKEEGDIPAVAVMADSFAKQLPSDVLFHVNLLPSYGTGKGSSWGGKISHDAYVDQYVTDVVSKLPAHRQTLSVDNYPLLSSNIIRESYLKDLWYIGNKAKMARTDGKDVVVNYCIQAFSDSSSTELRTPETRADLSFQVNTGLALGAQSFEYFEYYDYDAASDSINGILSNGLYDQVQSINRELRAWDHIFLSFDWQGVKTYNTAAAYTNGVTELGSLQSITVSADQATLVGEYKYGNTEEYGYMITNFTEPSAETTDTVTLMMAANQSVLVYKNGTGRWMNADSDGKLTLALEAGGGAFVIPQ